METTEPTPIVQPSSPEMPPTNERYSKLEKFDLNDNCRVDLALVLAGEKPATIVRDITAFIRADGTRDQRDPSKLSEVYDWAIAAGLSAELINQNLDGTYPFRGPDGPARIAYYTARGNVVDLAKEALEKEERTVLFVAKDLVWLESMKAAEESGVDSDYGRCYGFPRTAIDGFTAGNQPGDHNYDVPDEVKVFGTFVKSPEHWEAESAVALRWAETIKHKMPELYDRRMNLNEK